jgi:hypothetical protein
VDEGLEEGREGYEASMALEGGLGCRIGSENLSGFALCSIYLDDYVQRERHFR